MTEIITYIFDSRDLSVELPKLDTLQKIRDDLEEGQYIIYYNRKLGVIESDNIEDIEVIKRHWFHVFDYEVYGVSSPDYDKAMRFFMEMSLEAPEKFRDYTYSLSGSHAHILVVDRPFWDDRLKKYLQEDFAQEAQEWYGYA